MTSRTDARWHCHFCKRNYSHNYAYKTHLQRCVVHREEMDTKYDMLGDIMCELKQELRKDFQLELTKICHEMRNEIKQTIGTTRVCR
jgi:hypothetical protein